MNMGHNTVEDFVQCISFINLKFSNFVIIFFYRHVYNSIMNSMLSLPFMLTWNWMHSLALKLMFYYGAINSCTIRCGNQTDCFDSWLPLTQTLSKEQICNNTFVSNQTSHVITHQITLNVLENQNILLQVDELFVESLSIDVFKCTKNFIWCNISMFGVSSV